MNEKYFMEKLDQYTFFEVYDCPEKPTEYGRYIGRTPILQQAIETASRGSRFIKGVTQEGKRVVFL